MHMIDLSIDHGSISGYVVDAKQENIQNYLNKHSNLGKSIAWKLAQRREIVALLRNLYVDPEHRGQGIGSELVSSFIQEAEHAGATCYILVSDDGEEQIDDFDLNAWYEGFGFSNVVGTDSGPLMAQPDALVEDLREFLGPSEPEGSFEP